MNQSTLHHTTLTRLHRTPKKHGYIISSYC